MRENKYFKKNKTIGLQMISILVFRLFFFIIIPNKHT